MQRRILHHIIFIIGCCLAHGSRAQLLRATITADRDTILIGEPIVLQLKVTGADTALDHFEWFSPTDTFGHFEVVQKTDMQRTTQSGLAVAEQEIIITSFDSGYWQVPPFVSGSVATNAIPVMVQTVTTSPLEDYRDIKEIIQVKKPFDYMLAGMIAGGVVLLALIIWLVLRYLKKHPPVKAKTAVAGTPPYEAAIQALDNLAGRQLPEAGKAKLFHSELDGILKEYIVRQSGLALLVQTNKELLQVLQSYRLPESLFTSLEEALRLSDAAKFAKFQPAAEQSYNGLQTIRSVITSIHRQPQQSI